jgi:hypothetical protein
MYNNSNSLKFTRHYLRSQSTWDIGIFGYSDVISPKERFPEVCQNTLYNKLQILSAPTNALSHTCIIHVNTPFIS